MAYNLTAKIELIDDFSRPIKSIQRTFKGFTSNIKSAVDDILSIATSAQEATNEIADASRETRQLAKRMEDASNEASEAALAAVGFRTALAGVQFPDLNISRIRDGLNNISGSIPLIVAGLSAGSAATGPLVAGVGGLAASFAAAGAGAVAFGAVSVSVLGKVFEAADEVQKIQEKIDNADTLKERIAAQKELAAVYEGMSTAQKGALKDLQSFKSFWGGFVKQFEEPIFEAFSSGLQFTQKLLTGLTPTITNVADVVNELMGNLNKSIDGGGFKDFFTWLEINAAEAIRSFAIVGGNLLSGLFSIFQAFAPIGASMEEGLISLTQRFKDWAASLEGSNGFKTFIEYAKQNGPVLMDTLGNLGQIMKNLITDLTPFGTVVLDGLKSVTDLIVNNWSGIRETIIGITAAVVAYKGVMTGMAIVGTVTKLMAAYRAGTLLATAAQMGLNVAMFTNPFGLVIAGISALIGIGVVLYRNWNKITDKAKELFAKLLTMKTSTLALLGPFGLIIAAGVKVYKNWDKIKATAKDVFGAVKDWIGGVKDKWDALTSAISKFKMPKFDMPSFNMPSWVPGFKTGIERVPTDNMPAVLHKNESVLTADQSDTLRKMGVLKSNGTKPVVDTAPLNSGRSQTKTAISEPKSNKPTSVSIGAIHINGVNKTTKEMAREFVDEVNRAFNLGVV